MSPFEYAGSLSATRDNIWVDGISEKEYNPYMVNRALSYHVDTVMYAQEMNARGHLPPKMQYDFYRLGITSKKKRFSKWHKPEKDEIAQQIAMHYGLSLRQAQQYMTLLNNDEMSIVMEKLNKGGRNGK